MAGILGLVFLTGKVFGNVEDSLMTNIRFILAPIIIGVFPLYFYMTIQKISWMKKRQMITHLVIFIFYFGVIFRELIILPFNPDFYIEGIGSLGTAFWVFVIFGLFLPHAIYLFLLRRQTPPVNNLTPEQTPPVQR